MKISSKGRYAVSALIDLALQDNGVALTIAEISRKQNISLSYLEQIFAQLRKNGLVKGTRGPGGGYRLAKVPADISVAEVIESLGEKGMDRGTENYVPYAMWSGFSAKLKEFLDKITLEDIIRWSSEGKDVLGEMAGDDSVSEKPQGQVAA